MKTRKINFNLMLIGQVISILASSLIRISLSIYVLDLTGRADLFAGMLAISIIPGIFLLPIGGVLSDHYNRKKMMVFISFLSFLTVIMFIYVFKQFDLGLFTIGSLILVLSSLNALYQPLIQSSVPMIVEKYDYAKANGYLGSSSAFSNIIGPLVAGFLYGILGVEKLIFIGALVFLVASILEIFIHIDYVKSETESMMKKMFSDLKTGLHFMIKIRPHIVKLALVGMGLNLFLMPFFIVGAPFIIRVSLKASDSIYGISVSIIQGAGVIGALLVGVLAQKIKTENLYKLILFMGILMLPIAFSVTPLIMNLGFIPTYISLMFFMIPIIMMMTIATLLVVTYIQMETPKYFIGKVIAVATMISQIAAPAGQYLFGLLVEYFNAYLFIPPLIIALFLLMLSMLTKKLL